MAGIDSSIYFQQQPIDVLGSLTKGMGMRDSMDQRKFQQGERERAAQERANQTAVQNAYGQAIVQNPDGTTSFDNAKFQNNLATLAPNNPLAGQKMYEFGLGLKQQNQADQTFAAKQEAEKLDGLFKRAQIGKLNAEARELDRKPSAKALTGENLPLDQRKMVETLSTKNANKIAIQNQIQAVVDNWDQLSDDQKLVQGNQLLKTLNSSEGADAIGVEEAKRLGSMLEFQVGNFTQPGAFFGRDLGGFKDQAQNTANNIGSAVKSNQTVIDRAMGRPTDFINPVQVIAPDGTIRTIPKNQLQNALANGGKLVGNGG